MGWLNLQQPTSWHPILVDVTRELVINLINEPSTGQNQLKLIMSIGKSLQKML